MKRPVRAAILILAAGVLAGLAVRQARQSRAESAVFTGQLEAEESRVGSTVGGRVARVLVQEGDLVRRGDRLWTFESRELEAALARAEAAERQARHALADLVAGTRPQTIEQAREAAREAESRLLRLQRGSRPEEIAAAEAALGEAEARASLVQAGTRQEQKEAAQATLEAASAEATRAARDHERAAELYRSGAISRQALDASERQMQVASANRKAAASALAEAERGARPQEIRAAREAAARAKAALALLRNGSRSEDVAAARAALAGARARVAELQAGARPEQIRQAREAVAAAQAETNQLRARLRERAVYAPVEGQVAELGVQPGDLVPPGAPAATITDQRRLYVRLYLTEQLVSRLRLGDSLKLETDAGDEVPAIVEQIPPQPEFTPRNVQTRQERELQVYSVKLRVQNPKLELRAGMSVTYRAAGG